MTYEELNDLIEGQIGVVGIDFLHSESDHINPYRGDFPLAVLDPPTATFEGAWPFSPVYGINIAFMGLLHNDSDWDTRRTVVQAMDAYARELVQRLYQLQDHTTITGVIIRPFFTFTFSSHLTAGVILSFDYLTQDAFDYCAIE